MKLGIMSDSHDNLPNVAKAVKIFNQRKVQKVLHAGDIIAPFVTRNLLKLNCDVLAVFGNNDGDKLYLQENFGKINKVGEIKEPPVSFKLAGKRIYLTHWPHQLEILAESGIYDIIVYGHTHDAEIRRVGKTLVVNPGETGGWLREKATIAVVDLETMEAEIIEL